MLDTMHAMLANGENVSAGAFLYGNLGSDTQGGSAELYVGTWLGRLDMAAHGFLAVLIKETLSEALGAAIYLSGDSYAVSPFDAALVASVALGEEIYYRAATGAAMRSRAAVGENIHHATMMVGIVDGQIATVIYDIRYTDLDIEIPPNGTLVIDSDNCAVLLNGEDVIDCHSGKWIMLNRKIADIVVQNPLHAELLTKILYTEKYL